ncbi:long-chain fatty acid--CoA ligase [Mangrovactinospora gilvigrisea]|uniref:Acyl-CoA synthetase n=1 Tax=Mangrovactinospora gilvigrisea TaxID=1428644 RepID=A0A1J7BAH4_9ACTN|nr:AMP-dependent synthetase/ligase [Mangrovactinospora gilvigrisea]OIV35614.1 long-chain fatty acid--CoA ligase [Mangrovactinospora gilvigrisea]
MREFSLPPVYTVPDGGNLTDAIRTNAERTPDRAVAARLRPDGQWQDVTAAAFLAEVLAAAKGLMASGVEPGDRVGLMSRTRYEWTLLDYAIWCAGAVTVPVYETSSAEQVAWILGDSGAAICLVETAAHRAVVEEVRERLPRLGRVAAIDEGAVAELAAAGELAGTTDAAVLERASLAGPDTLATIVYTSGTTGRPKGCELTHGNFLAELGTVIEVAGPLFAPGGSLLLFLPLAHVLGRILQIACMMDGLKLGHCPDAKELQAQLATFRPTLVIGVPRVFEKVYYGARAKAEAEGKGRIFRAAADTAIAFSRARDDDRGPGLGLRLRHKLFDKLVFGRLREAMGGRVRHAISGGAPLAEELAHFFRGAGVTILEGYGLTETCAAIVLNPVDAPKLGTVGRVLPCARIRIAEDGEILLAGENVFRGYRGNPEATAEALADGWFRTGDLGRLDEDGYLSVTGRKKELIVTAGGKNVAPAVIEDRVRAHPLIAECMVVGDQRPFVAALVTLDREYLATWRTAHRKPAQAEVSDLVRDPELLAEVQAAVDDGNKAVSRAEAVKKFRVLTAEWTEESGHLTPSLKLRRAVVAREFAAEIEELYRAAPAARR